MNNHRPSMKKQFIRLLKYSSSAPFKIGAEENPGSKKIQLERDGAAKMVFSKEVFEALIADGLLNASGSYWMITDAGKLHLRRQLSQVDEFANQHRLTGRVEIVENGKKTLHQSNAAESPLARLRMRNGADGKPYICDANYQAGERLRSDFTRGQMMPRVSSNWESSIGGGKHSGGRNGIADLSDTALAARIRTGEALDAAGPEFSGVLVDICCFLKGLEQVERERKWPPRSAKLMLNTALSILARHYGLSTAPSKQGSIRHWGGDNFQPEMFFDG